MEELTNTINNLNNKIFVINGISMKIKSFTQNSNTVSMCDLSGKEHVINLTTVNNDDNQTSDANMTEVNNKIKNIGSIIDVNDKIKNIGNIPLIGGADSTDVFFAKNFGYNNNDKNNDNNNKNGLFFVKYQGNNSNMKGGHNKNIVNKTNDIFNSESTSVMCGVRD